MGLLNLSRPFLLPSAHNKTALATSIRLLSASSHLSQRSFSTTTPQKLDASKLKITKKDGPPSPMPPLESLVFGRTFSDHMLNIEWDSNNGWHAPHIEPFRNLSLHPAVSSLHYGLQCFEGMKAFVDARGKLRLFRPDMNMKRLNASCKRLALPEFDGNEYVKCLKELLKVDRSFVPAKDGYSMYIRPTAIATQPTLGVSMPGSSLLYTILSPVGPYYPTGFKPVSLLADPSAVRAWPGGVGDCKVGGNYAPTILPQGVSAKQGYSQLLWLFPHDGDHLLTEVGTMNLFIFWKNEQGEKELVTCPLADQLVLPGVTRDSVLKLAKDMGEFKVSERRIYMKRDFMKAVKENRIIEVFGAGTAAVISPVERIGFEGVDYEMPLDPKDPSKGAGPLASRMLKELQDIQYGRREHQWSVLVE